MYNTQYKVKYNDIEQELLNKLKVKTTENLDEDEEYEYSTQDILDICNKLYRDELLSVFELEELDEEKMNAVIDSIYDKIMENIKFKNFMDELKKLYIKDFLLNEDIEDPKKDVNIRKMLMTSLFVQPLFYITHKCICQQLNLGVIDNELLVELRKHTLNLVFSN